MKSVDGAGDSGAAQSPSVRRAWIEILQHASYYRKADVALREEGVD